MRAVVAAAALTLLAASSTLALARKPRAAAPYTQLAHVPDGAAAKANPLEAESEAPAAGKKLYARHCGDCHGLTGERGRKGPSLRAQEVQTASAGALFWVITHGNVRAGMPAWSKLPEPQRWQITTYLKSLGQSP